MRKTLFALLGLVAVGLWAVPVLAGVTAHDPPKAYAPIPLENRAGAIGAMAKNGNYQATLSGSMIKQASATTTWFLYAGACADRAAGTWVARTDIQADSLNTYTVGTQGGYGRSDQSLSEIQWHIVDTATPANQRPAAVGEGGSDAINGSRAIWCGKYDPNWVNPVGYPNLTNQILYLDLEANRAAVSQPTAAGGTYSLSMRVNISDEQNYDFTYIMGGGDNDLDGFGDEDPLGNDRAKFDAIRAAGSSDEATLQATLTGSLINTTPGLVPFINGNAGPTIVGEGGSEPQTLTLNFQTSMTNRALYILFTADCLFSGEDGLWPFGHGNILDDIVVSDNKGLPSSGARVIYDEGVAAGGTDGFNGNILSASTAAFDTDGVMISARVFPGKGELWAIQQGNVYTTADICSPGKNLSTDRFFLGVDPATKNAFPGQFNSIVTCTFPVPPGTADILAIWGEYLNIPRTTGYVQYSEYRQFQGGSWSNWNNTAPGGGVRTSTIDQWLIDGDNLAAAVQADSFQVRYNLQCIAAFAVDRTNCDNNTQYAILYDDLYVQVTTGVPAPVFGIFVGSVGQSTFVDGTMTGLNCTVTPCWPGIRGTDLQTNPNVDIARSAVKDNMNSPLGDSLTMAFVTGLRKNGMGINWHQGFDKAVGGGLAITHTNPNYNATFGGPMVIYRLYDPATTTWSDWDSTEVDANNVSVAADTVIIDSEYRLNWPPRDKAGQTLPGGFTINGEANYSNLAFLPRGTRMQYYFKAVDINGGTAYQFQTDASGKEVADLPTLPGSGLVAPDIVQFEVLPGKYPAGTAGTLLAGRTDTPILDLDGVGTSWSFGQNPVVQALRGLGVRADRYRYLQGLGEGANFGGHELAGIRPQRFSNYFPNKEEYGIVDSLVNWYRIMIQSSHTRTPTVFEEADAAVLSDWAKRDTGPNGGDRCVFFSGDDAFNAITNQPVGVPGVLQQAMSIDIFGVSNVQTLAASGAKGSWSGASSDPYPQIDDRFAAPGSGPGLAAPGSFIYETDAGCPGPNRFDPLTPQSVSATSALAAATYPLAAGVTDVAAVRTVGEWDVVSDNDKTKALGYGYSIQYVRGAPGAVPRTAANYARSGVENRMKIMYKFLTSCRGAGATASCWPCPTDAGMLSNWNGLAGFQTGTYGPLYPIQDFTQATGVEIEEASAAPRVNRLDGNAPNPFNPLTKISFSAAKAGKVTIKIYNVAGQLVRTLETKVETAGPASVLWDGKNNRGAVSPSGVYFTKATFADGKTISAKNGMTLLK